jgi:hypothetical protein
LIDTHYDISSSREHVASLSEYKPYRYRRNQFALCDVLEELVKVPLPLYVIPRACRPPIGDTLVSISKFYVYIPTPSASRLPLCTLDALRWPVNFLAVFIVSSLV